MSDLLPCGCSPSRRHSKSNCRLGWPSDWRQTLARNLAWAAALCRADTVGWMAGYNDATDDDKPAPFAHWKPGCGVAAPEGGER